MNPRPGRAPARSVARVLLAAVLATAPVLAAPVLAAPTASGISPADAAAAGYVPNPAPRHARITIDSVTPDVLDGTAVGGTVQGVPTVTVTGTVHNLTDAPIDDIDVRLQRGPRAQSAAAVREPLTWSEASFPLAGDFQPVVDTLAPGASTGFRVSMPARAVPGHPGPDLQLTENGVYPLLVNVNGSPGGAGAARLDDARTLLPVLDAPRPDATRTDTARPGAATPAPATPAPATPAPEPGESDQPAAPPAPAGSPLTLVLPLAVSPTRLAHVPGADGPDAVVGLTDDSLPRALARDGRLTGLLDAADGAFAAPGGAELRRATCIAVDPDLLDTVSSVADGRRVVVGSGEPVPESLADDARTWLEHLRTTVGDECLVSLPAAQADLDAVAGVGEPELVGAALDRPGTVRRVLGRDPLPDVVLPASGTLAPGTAAGLGLDRGTVVTAASSTRTDTGLVPPAGVVELAGSGLRALTYEPAQGAALAATGEHPENPRYSDPGQRYWLSADSPAARLQDARATLLAGVAGSPSAPGAPDAGVFAVPPAVWSVDGTQAASLLRTFTEQLRAGRMRPLPLTERLAGAVTTPAGRVADDPTGAGDPGAVPVTAVDSVRDSMRGLATLEDLVDDSDPAAGGATAHLAPIAGDALRALSVTGRREDGDGVTLGADTGRAARDRTLWRLERLGRTVRDALGRVDLLPPGSVFTMASPNSPLLLVTRNGLPFPVQVTVHVEAPESLKVEPVGMVQVPANGSRTLQLPTEAVGDDPSRRTVRLTLLDASGRPLSQPVVLSVQSGGYPLAVAFTVAAGALALALAVRRYLRYRRGTYDPADEGHRP